MRNLARGINDKVRTKKILNVIPGLLNLSKTPKIPRGQDQNGSRTKIRGKGRQVATRVESLATRVAKRDTILRRALTSQRTKKNSQLKALRLLKKGRAQEVPLRISRKRSPSSRHPTFLAA
jgi:hypothetical protein